MTGPGDRFSDRPIQEWLAAYADGELDPAGRARVEEWLNDHPDARAELETQRRLSGKNSKLWRSTAAQTPGEGSWARVIANVREALVNPPRPAEPAGRRPRGLAFVAAGTAAAALLAVGLFWPAPPAPHDSNYLPDEEAYAVAGDDDIEIVSLPGADEDLIVVGRLPLDGPIVLATVADVALEKVNKDTDGMMPIVQGMQAGPNAPMIIAPMPGR